MDRGIKRKKMKKFKYFDWILFFIILILVFFLTRSTNKIKEYRDEKKEFIYKMDSLQSSYVTLELRFNSTKAQLELLIAEKGTIQSQLERQKMDYMKLKNKHEKEIYDLLALPDDTIYRKNTRWLDSLSLHR